jgi:hypothetical protein
MFPKSSQSPTLKGQIRALKAGILGKCSQNVPKDKGSEILGTFKKKVGKTGIFGP